MSRSELDEVHHKHFTAELINALEDAQRAAEGPQSAAALAQQAYEELQFDFPLVRVNQLNALAACLRSGSASAQPQPRVTNKFVQVVQEGAVRGNPALEAAASAAARGPGSSAVAGEPEAEDPLCVAYQKVYAAALFDALHRVAMAELNLALDLLQLYEPPAASPEEEENPVSSAGDVPSDWDCVTFKIVHLAQQLRYQYLASSAVWRELGVMDLAARCITQLLSHRHLPALVPAVEAVCALVHDRITSCPGDVTDLPSVLDALRVSQLATIPQSSPVPHPTMAGATLGLSMAASLAGRLKTVSSQRRLWQEAHDTLLPAGASLLERCEVQRAKRAKSGAATDAGQEAEQAEAALMVSQLAYFYVLYAPPAAAHAGKMKEALLRGGLFRGLTLLFGSVGPSPAAGPLRRALLAACVAAPELTAWAAAVPGFSAAWEGPEFRHGRPLQLHAALWAALRDAKSGDEALAAVLHQTRKPLEADQMPGVHSTLCLLSDLQTAARGPRQVWGPATSEALAALGSALRSACFAEEEEEEARDAGAVLAAHAAGEGGLDEAAAAEAEEAADQRKLEQTPERQARVLAARRARQVQPECLRLAKILVQRPGAAGKAD